MLLTFKRKQPELLTFVKGALTFFKLKIRSGHKITSFRVGQRWKPGMAIHFWENSPRNPNQEPEPFSIPHARAAYWGKDAKGNIVPLCAGVEFFEMTFHLDKIENHTTEFFKLKIGHEPISEYDRIRKIANQDGLTIQQFIMWFYHAAIEIQKEKMKLEGTWVARKPITSQPEWPSKLHVSGDVVHWTTHFYTPTNACYWDDNEKKAKTQTEEVLS